MKKISVAILLTLVVGLGALGIYRAMASDQRDGADHPFVGMMLAYDANGNPIWRCSGTLLSERVFLTSAHCTHEAVHVEIWFAPGPIIRDENYNKPEGTKCANPAITSYACYGDVGGTPYTHPLFKGASFFVHDVGVVILDEPMAMAQYATLPSVNQLNALKPGEETTFTAVGYGLQKSFPDAESARKAFIRERMITTPHLIQINIPGSTGDFSMLLSNHIHSGGICFGDSGGPNFLGNSNVIAAVTSLGTNGNCAGTGGVFRLDSQDVLDFIYSYLK